MLAQKPHFALILAGGRATRFGGAPKGLALLRGKLLIQYVADSMQQYVDTIAVNVSPGMAPDYLGLGLPVIEDTLEDADRGPLSGILTGLNWAHDNRADALLIAPCDAPCLTSGLWSALLAELHSSGADAIIAAGAVEMHPLYAAFRPGLAPRLKSYLADPAAKLAVRAFLDGIATRTLKFSDEAQFLNINTQQDLIQAEAALGVAPRP